jgi:hypothetical protein
MAEHASWEMVGKGCEELITMAAKRSCPVGYYECGEAVCIAMIQSKKKLLDKVMLKEALQKEKIKS